MPTTNLREKLNIPKRILKKIERKRKAAIRDRVRSLRENPPAVIKNTILFVSTEDFSDNPRALYEYMIDHGYNKKYKITWLFEYEDNFRDLHTPNVRSVKMWNKYEQRTPESIEAVLTSEYLFFSHNINWAKVFQPEQHYIELWHGCGYKGRQPGETRIIHFDKCVTTGPKYARELTTHYLCEAEKLIPLGYPRNDWFRTHKTRADEYLADIKEKTDAKKVLIWMPTFRKSHVSRLETATSIGELGLPLVETQEDLSRLDELCHKKSILLIVKTHTLDAESAADYDGLTNIIHLDNPALRKENVNLYELLAQTDALLTDYSSVAVDYLLLDKPIGYILSDYDEYDRARGWCYDNVKEYMPGHHIYDKAGLEEYIADIASGRDGFTAARTRVRSELQTESESYCRDILDYFGIVPE